MTQTFTRAVSVRADQIVDASTSAVIPHLTAIQQLTWGTNLVAGVADQVLKAHWDAASIDQMCASLLPSGQRAPSFAYKRVDKLWGPSWPLEDAFTCSRVGRMGKEDAGRILRSTQHRLRVFDAVIAGGHTKDAVTDKAMETRIDKFEDEHGALPASLFDLEPQPPRSSGALILAATDTQYSMRMVNEDQSRMLVVLKLPTVAKPTGPGDWTAVHLTVPIPQRYRSGKILAPTIRVLRGTRGPVIMVDVAVEYPVPDTSVDDGRVLGVDWGGRRLLSATLVRRDLDAPDPLSAPPVVDGRPMFFTATILLRDSRMLMTERERLVAKIKRCKDALGRRSCQGADIPNIRAKIDKLEELVRHINDRQSNLHKQIAQLAGLWVVHQAVASEASVIVLENLATLQASGKSRRVNVMLNLALRGQVQQAVELAAEVHGIKVRKISAYGTSKFCPRCNAALDHKTAPNGKAGYAWASCPSCGYQGDRDQAASENVGRRVAAPKAKRVRHLRSKKRDLAQRPLKVPTPKTSPTPKRPGKRTNKTRRHLYGAVTPSNRSTGPVTKRRISASQSWKKSTSVDILSSLLQTYRHTLRATPVLYWRPPGVLRCEQVSSS